MRYYLKVLVCFIVLFIIIGIKTIPSFTNNSIAQEADDKADDQFMGKPDPKTEYFTFTLPGNASTLRLSLPAAIEDIFYSEKTGIGGFGLHAGAHFEGLDHVWIELKPDTIIKSWADGIVTDIRRSGYIDQGEIHITIDYDQNLIGIHMEIDTPLVQIGDFVRRGQDIGYGQSYDPEQSSAEFALADKGRIDGVEYYSGGVYVSPFDYLVDSEKKKLIEAYKKYVIKPYIKEGKKSSGFHSYQPYLTNRMFLHEWNKGKLSGEWYLISSKWAQDFPNDFITFIEDKNPYHNENVVLAANDQDEGRKTDWSIDGTFEVDYKKGRVKIINYDNTTYYGIFEIDESERSAQLKIEYQEGRYPKRFSSKANTYIERTNLSRREDASLLGVLDDQ